MRVSWMEDQGLRMAGLGWFRDSLAGQDWAGQTRLDRRRQPDSGQQVVWVVLVGKWALGYGLWMLLRRVDEWNSGMD